HSLLFHNQAGTFSSLKVAFSASVNSTLNFLISEFRSLKAFVYSPFGSRMINRLFNFCPSGKLLDASSSDHLIKPATLQDFPLPVFPSIATCLPKSLSG